MQKRKPGSKKRKKEETSLFQNILQLFKMIVTGLESHDYEGSITVSIYMRVILASQIKIMFSPVRIWVVSRQTSGIFKLNLTSVVYFRSELCIVDKYFMIQLKMALLQLFVVTDIGFN